MIGVVPLPSSVVLLDVECSSVRCFVKAGRYQYEQLSRNAIARNMQTTLLVANPFDILADIPGKIPRRSSIFIIVICYRGRRGSWNTRREVTTMRRQCFKDMFLGPPLLSYKDPPPLYTALSLSLHPTSALNSCATPTLGL
jgi:hypothetical protein